MTGGGNRATACAVFAHTDGGSGLPSQSGEGAWRYRKQLRGTWKKGDTGTVRVAVFCSRRGPSLGRKEQLASHTPAHTSRALLPCERDASSIIDSVAADSGEPGLRRRRTTRAAPATAAKPAIPAATTAATTPAFLASEDSSRERLAAPFSGDGL